MNLDEGGAPAFDPVPPGAGERVGRWWGNHPAELRWQAEAARLLVDPVFYGREVPHGDGRPVVLLPGFLAGDYTLGTMALWLRRLGYRPSRCGFLFNVDCSERSLGRVEDTVDAMHRRYARRVAVIGHSRGGHFARALAVRRPDRVSHVVSLGAGLNRPYDISAPAMAAVAAVRAAHRRMSDRARERGCLSERCTCSFAQAYAAPFPSAVRLTSIYSRGDGVVRWRSCVVPYAHTVEVTGSHVGLAFNRKAYRVMAHALAAPER
ncbi:MAG: alpha/beta fold hydrolase [Thermoleophilaceae bacterium]|nr:alpha/beta fold hydrolase [Thermoleophilaceae bacterium]